jgi:hypothetical protein
MMRTNEGCSVGSEIRQCGRITGGMFKGENDASGLGLIEVRVGDDWVCGWGARSKA